MIRLSIPRILMVSKIDIFSEFRGQIAKLITICLNEKLVVVFVVRCKSHGRSRNVALYTTINNVYLFDECWSYGAREKFDYISAGERI